MIAGMDRILDRFYTHNSGRIVHLGKFRFCDPHSFLIIGLPVILQTPGFVDLDAIDLFV